VLYPVFVHVYLQLVQYGASHVAADLLKQYRCEAVTLGPLYAPLIYIGSLMDLVQQACASWGCCEGSSCVAGSHSGCAGRQEVRKHLGAAARAYVHRQAPSP
jgi:hypothetical protein